MRAYLEIIYDLCTKRICEVILCICLFFSFYYQTQDNDCEKIFSGDGLGYYSYLPAIFIYNDYGFSFTKSISEKHKKMNFGNGFLVETGNGKVNKYYVGLSILLLPFFLLAHLLETLFGSSLDGYARIYQVAVLIAANFYVWLGCRYLRRLILSYSIPESIAAFILILTLFGTNLFFYTTFHASYTHAYSFAIIAIFLFCIHSFMKNENAKLLYLSAFLLGLIVLLRPTNVVIAIMFLFFAGSFNRFWEVVKQFAFPLLISGVIFLLTLFPQSLLYFLQSGHFIVWSYGGEKFNFDNPEFFNVLFSYQKGLFVYTPLALLALAGLIYLFRTSKFQFAVMLSLLFLSTYIISSWWCWYYGASLGQRVFVDYYAIVALLLTLLYLSFTKQYHKWIFIATSLPLVFYSLMLTYQYRHNILDYAEMNRQKFWFTFLRTDPGIEGLVFSGGLFSNPDHTNIVNNE